MENVVERSPKKLFIVLLAASYGLMLLVAALLWKITYLGLLDINEYLPGVFGVFLGVVVFLMGFGIISMVAGLRGWPLPSLFKHQTYVLLNMLFPVVIGAGRLVGVDRRRIEASFVAVSNQLVQNRHLKVPVDRLLVVTPHCLQLATCPHKITRDPMNCKRCGGCDIGALVTMADEMGFHFFVVTGGTLARQTVQKIHPKAVVAIACERDLTSGIQDVYPIPTVGVLNIRPNGPCFNTHVDLDELRKAIEDITEKPERGDIYG